jgi:NCAIR mutase (PurE)-related protein
MLIAADAAAVEMIGIVVAGRIDLPVAAETQRTMKA